MNEVDKRNIDRRKLLGGMAAASMVAACSAGGEDEADEGQPASPAQETAKLRHQVYFWLKNPGSIEDRDKLIAGLETLRTIEEVRDLRIGIPADTEARDVTDHSFAVSETMLFDDRDAQLAYQQHPIHQAFVEECEDLWERVVVYDSVDI